MIRSISLLTLLLVAGCGAEVAGTAAVGTGTAVEAANQARETQSRVQEQLDAATRLEQQRLEQTEAGSRP